MSDEYKGFKWNHKRVYSGIDYAYQAAPSHRAGETVTTISMKPGQWTLYTISWRTDAVSRLSLTTWTTSKNVYIERYNRTVCYNWLSHHCLTRCLCAYNHDHPNMALDDITPKQKLLLTIERLLLTCIKNGNYPIWEE